MKKPIIYCGAKTKTGGSCCKKVRKYGDRCYLHRKRPASAKHTLDRMFKVIGRVAALEGLRSAYEFASPRIMEIINKVGGYFMPEYFWGIGFPNDKQRMLKEINEARKKRDRLEDRYESYPDDIKLQVEKAYNDIMLEIDRVE